MTTLKRRTTLAGFVALTAALTLPGVTLADEAFPAKPVTIVVPFAAGGGGDFAARMVAASLQEHLGVPVNVLNRPGGDGVIGATAVATAEPDGYTLLMATPSPMNYAPAIHRTNPPYDPIADFRPVSSFGPYVFEFVVNSELPVTTLDEFVAYVRAHPGEVNYATGDSTAIVATAQFAEAAGLDMVHIPYSGSGAALPDLAANRVQAMFLTLSAIRQLEDKVRPLAVLFPERTHIDPDLPTFVELGYASVDLDPWSGFFTTAGAPDDVVNQMSEALNVVLSQPELVERFATFGTILQPGTPEELGETLAYQLGVWRRMVDLIGIPTD
ncbi:tripartite tricarboxylate transporter substrate binding protein [Pararhodobacter sp.]|uniref:Bug family tripartite tricarboxylate transporter substrate binding protein n=1 Tax=Pararhodobacter sp. TaxID=2127056 RepID=UPI002AFE81B1|nr:tripartite tricarboxylate transporter substrate binding protein [Pararhodobacter sp.]